MSKYKKISYAEGSKIQSESIQKYKEKSPDLLRFNRMPREIDMLKDIGIEHMPRGREKGYVKFYPLDFIVEEIRPSGRVVQVEPSDIAQPKKESGKTVYCDLVKFNTVQTDALEDLAKALNISVRNISVAGMKDKQALTSQRISIENVQIEDVKKLRFRHFYLKNFSYGDGRFYPGNLVGNRFTIFVRTETQPHQDFILSQIARIQTHGMYNYYHLQRFGNRRLSFHRTGMYMFQGRFDLAVKNLLTYQSSYDLKINNLKRAQAEKDFPNVKKIYDSYMEFPRTFRLELSILTHLLNNPEDYIGALSSMTRYHQIAAQAYGSYLFNAYISKHQDDHRSIPRELPIFPSKPHLDEKYYGPWLKKHGVSATDFEKHIKKLRNFMNYKKLSFRETRVRPTIHNIVIVPEGLLISFDLPLGSYATSFLNNFFILTAGSPPRWVKREKYDIKKSLKLGSVSEALNELKKK